jgi:hypothetical protein
MTAAPQHLRPSIDEMLASEDLRLFEKIESQTSDRDKRSLLAIQSAVREHFGSYSYLEIGSHLGGSIQPHLVDVKCEKVISIDKRPLKQPDERGFEFAYNDNSTERMLELLRAVDANAVNKIVTIDGSTDEIRPEQITDRIHLCLIDGEHTDAAMKRDFLFCRDVLGPAGGIIAFHDSQIVYNGVYECIEELKSSGEDFRAYSLPDALFVVELGPAAIHDHPQITARLINNHEAYLYALRENDRFRRFANRRPFMLMRKLYARLRSIGR